MARRSRPTGVSYVHEHMHVADIHAHMVQEKLTPYHAEKRAKEHGPQDNESASGCEVYRWHLPAPDTAAGSEQAADRPPVKVNDRENGPVPCLMNAVVGVFAGQTMTCSSEF